MNEIHTYTSGNTSCIMLLFTVFLTIEESLRAKSRFFFRSVCSLILFSSNNYNCSMDFGL